MIRNVLLGFGAIALLVGGFVIFNTLSITVAQRTREFATLRTLGASRKQVMRSVRLEGAIIGLVASVVGLVAGIGIAKGMVALFGALGVELPDAGTVIASHTITTSLIVGTGVTLLASILPAKRATRVPPIAAVREGSVLPASKFETHSGKTGVVVLGASLAAILAAMFADGVSAGLVAVLLAGGILGLFAAIALLAPRLVKPITRVVGWPARRTGGVAGQLAGANAGRNPKRTASTAAALMIGLTLVTVVAVLGSGISTGTKSAIKKQVHADHVIDGTQGLPFRAAEGDKLAAIPGVKAASNVRSDEAIVQGKQSKISGIDPATIEHFYSFYWTDGSSRTLEQLGTDGALVSKTYAEDKHLKVGSDVSIKTPTGDSHTVVVRGIYDPPEASPMLDDVVVTQKAFDSAYSQPKNSFTFLDADAASASTIKAAAKGYGDAKYHTGAAYPKDATKEMAMIMGMLYVLLGFSVVVSLFGMVNTMVLSVFERTREIGMLRTIGMTRRQARRMIRHESIITALMGTALGVGLGLFLSALVTQAVSMDGLPLTVPVPTLAAFTLLAVAAGIGAAVLPARRASRLNVLDALHYE
jgi:putative ABC transport system permease protein